MQPSYKSVGPSHSLSCGVYLKPGMAGGMKSHFRGKLRWGFSLCSLGKGLHDSVRDQHAAVGSIRLVVYPSVVFEIGQILCPFVRRLPAP